MFSNNNLMQLTKIIFTFKIILRIGLFITSIIILNCQHARIRISPQLPIECKPWEDKKFNPECQAKRLEQKKSLEVVPTTIKEYDQDYYYWGLRPITKTYRLDEECPNGVLEIHQFSTFKNALYEQLTIGIYSPRTMRLTCFEKNPYQPTQPSKKK